MFRKPTKRAKPASRRTGPQRDPQPAWEEALWPRPFLGFDRDQPGCYLVGRGALELAGSQFRRAVWLNPFELSFRVHRALALTKLERRPEAHDILREVLAKNPEDKEALESWHQNWPDEQPTALASAWEHLEQTDAGDANAETGL